MGMLVPMENRRQTRDSSLTTTDSSAISQPAQDDDLVIEMSQHGAETGLSNLVRRVI